MPRLRGKVDRQQLPSGRDGQVLVLDTHSPQGIAWRSGIDRLVTDITPELSGDLDCNSFALTELGNVTFAAGTNTVAGIQSQNLVDKNSPSFTGNAVMNDNSVTGIDTLTFTDTAGTIAGVQNQNLVDKSAAETIAGAWTFGSDIAMGTRKVTGLGAPSAGTDAANKTYVDTVGTASVLPDAYYCGSKTLGSGATTVATNGVTWATKPTTFTSNLSSLWAEDGTTGDIVYTGTATRKFYVSWSLTLDFVSAGSIYAQNTTIAGKIEKIPDGGSVGDVAGSIGESGSRGYYLTAFGQYYFMSHASRGAVVSMATDDTLNFRYGFCNRYAVSVTYTSTLVAYAGTTKGVTLNIIPVDAAA